MTHSDPEAGVFVLDLPWDRPPLTLNQRLHYRPKAALTASVRATVAGLASDAGIAPMTRPMVSLVWLVTSRHRRDADNLVATLKAAADGLVDAGVAADDAPEFMAKGMPIVAYAKGHPSAPGLFLIVWEAAGPTPEESRALRALEVTP